MGFLARFLCSNRKGKTRKLTMDGWTCQILDGTIRVRHRNKEQGEYPLLEEPYCSRCSSPGKKTDSCSWHSRFPSSLARVFAVGPYYPLLDPRASLLSTHINQLKTEKQYSIPLGLAMSLVMLNRYSEDLRKCDLVAPVPLHQDSLATRGYDQSQELAKIISKQCQMRQASLLTKLKEVKQRGKGMEDRWNQVQEAYSCNTSCIGKAILLVDDVLTSGASLSECASVLARKGARMISGLVAGRDAERF